MTTIVSPSDSPAARAAQTYHRAFVVGMCRALAGLPGFAAPGLAAELEAAYGAMFLGFGHRPAGGSGADRFARFAAAAVAVVGHAEALYGRETVASVCGV